MLPSATRAAARARAPLARARAAAAPPRARGLTAALPPLAARPRAPLVFFVQRAVGANFAEVEIAAGASVAALVRAAAAELRLDAPPDAVELSLAGAAPGAPPLDATETLDAALAAGALAPRARLRATVREEPVAFRREGAGAAGALETQPVVSDADFSDFLAGKTMWAVRAEAGGEKKVRQVLRLDAARKVLATPGLYLLVREKDSEEPK